MKYILKAFISLSVLFICTVAYGQKGKIIKIDTDDLSMIYTVSEDGMLYFRYFGPTIADAEPFLSKKSYRRADYSTDPLGFPAAGGRNTRQAALTMTHSDGDINTELGFIDSSTDLSPDGNVSTTTLTLNDTKLPFTVEYRIKAYRKENVFTHSAVFTNGEESETVLYDFYSSYLPLKAGDYYLTSFHGAWAQEMFMEEERLMHGIRSIDNRKGVRTTHTGNPSFLLSLDSPLDEDCGNVIGGALMWSGNYRINFEIDDFDILGITAGINPHNSHYTLAPGEKFTAPEMAYTYSAEGAGGVSRNLHDWMRNYIVYDPGTIRPTLLNSWEGVYFDVDEKTIKDMIDDTAEMGLEMFVLDDGWFGTEYPRNSSGAGLGDWEVNRSKLPGGIGRIAEYAHSKGLKFGIWIEPEMVNPKSRLAEEHPEWIVKAEGRPVTTMRNQWLLDLTNPQVQDFVFGVFDRTMQLSPYISYIKWDANRHVESPGSSWLSADRQSHFWIDYTNGLYDVYRRIREKYPDVIVQACSSGGGRVDSGALQWHQEVWTSDNTDAVSRVFIQYGTNMIYPALVTGSHVSASPNHQSGNMTTLKYRFDMAMSGRLGMELQPKDLSPEEKEFARRAIENYKAIRDIVMWGDLYRISSPYSGRGYYSLAYVAKDKTRAVAYLYTLQYQGRTHTPVMKIKGLDPEKYYRVKELNVEKSSFWGDGMVFSGQYLINEGINQKLEKTYQSAVYLIEEAGN